MLYFKMNNPKDQILLDLYYYSLKFAIENDFSKIAISSFLSIIRSLHRVNEQNPFDNYSSLVKYFFELMICHSVKVILVL